MQLRAKYPRRALGILTSVLLMGQLAVPSGAETVRYSPDEHYRLEFSMNWDTGQGNELFVVGNHPDLGAWNPVAARKLRWTQGNVWTGAIAVAAGNEIKYKYIVRTNSAEVYCSAANAIWMDGPNLTTSAPARAHAPFTSKTLYYYSGWTNAQLLHRTGTSTNWDNTPMERLGDGRFPGESLYRATGVGQTGELLTFVPHGFASGDPEEKWDHCPVSWTQDYLTRLDAVVLQDGDLYNYWPPTNVTDSFITHHAITSDYTPEVPSRDIRIYLPRNYQVNPAKRYPVLYLHDGQNVFQPGGIYGCWNVELSADDMICLGLMRETLIVAIDNTAERMQEYIPPTDSPVGPGHADDYLAFVINNVKTFVDSNYRTLTAPQDTGVLGSSFGGVASLYFGMATNVFGKIGPMSTSFWAITNYLAQRVYGQDTSGLRIYTDFGSAESKESYQAMWAVHDKLLADGYVRNETLQVEVGCGHEHNEAAWAERVHLPLVFLFNARDEANWIAQSAYPPKLAVAQVGGNNTFSWTAMKGADVVLQRTGRLTPAEWANVATTRVDALMWAISQVTVSPPSGQHQHFYRLQSRPDGE